MATVHETKEILDNQIHGGMVICENVRNVFHAISQPFQLPYTRRPTGEIQVDILLGSIPSDELTLIKPKIETTKAPFDKKLIHISYTKIHERPRKESERLELDDIERSIKQQRSIAITQIVIDYLKSIGQWWYKRQSVPVSIVTPDVNTHDEEEFFQMPP